MDTKKLMLQLISHEGLKLFPYVDSVGKTSIGIGHNLSDKGLTKAQIFYIFNDDLTETLKFLAAHCPWWANLDDVRQRAIADLTFDLMGKVLDFKNMIEAIKVQDWMTASKELLNSHFATQVPKRAMDLAKMLQTGLDN